MIELRELSGNFRLGKNKTIYLDRISLRAENGRVTGLFGRKNSGKTVCMQVMAGTRNLAPGRVRIDGMDISGEKIAIDDSGSRRTLFRKRKEDLFLLRSSFGYVPDSTGWFHGLTGEEYLIFMADIYEVEQEERKLVLEQYMERLGLGENLLKKMSSYSISVYKKVMLLGTLLYGPGNLILDGFFEGMTGDEALLVKEILKEYARKENAAVLISDDFLKTAADLCDDICYLNEGKIIYSGSLQNLVGKYQDLASFDSTDLMLSRISEQLEKDDRKKSLPGPGEGS